MIRESADTGELTLSVPAGMPGARVCREHPRAGLAPGRSDAPNTATHCRSRDDGTGDEGRQGSASRSEGDKQDPDWRPVARSPAPGTCCRLPAALEAPRTRPALASCGPTSPFALALPPCAPTLPSPRYSPDASNALLSPGSLRLRCSLTCSAPPPPPPGLFS